MQIVLLLCYLFIAHASVQLNTPYLIDDFNQPLASNPYIDNSKTVSVILNNGGYEPSLDPASIPNWRKDIVGLWHLDENSGTSLQDSSVKAETATLYSGTFTSGHFGGGVSFDGTGYIEIPNDPFRADQPTKGYTTAAWIKFRRITPSAIIWERLFNNYEVDLTDVGSLQCFAAGVDYYIGDPYSVQTLNGTWIHVGCVYDPTTTSMILYVNGVLRSNNTLTGFDSFRHGDYSSIYLARRPPQYTPGTGLDGILDEFAIWKKPLTSQDFTSLYSQSSEITPSNGISFTSQDIVLPTELEARDIIVSWTESPAGALELYVSTDQGDNWCLVQNGVAIGRNQTDCLFPTVTFKYLVRWNDVFSSIQSINITFVQGLLPLDGIKAFPVGMNLGAVVYWSTSWDFVDYMKFGGGDGFPTTAQVNSLGYPTTDIAGLDTLLPSPQSRDYVSGQNFTLVLNGTGTVSLRFAPGNLNFDSPGTYYFPMPYPDQSIGMTITHTDPSDPINSIQLLHPGFTPAEAKSNPFHPFFLQRLQNFTSLRFMDYGLTNGQNLVNWIDRNTPDSIGQYRTVYYVKNIKSITFPYGTGGPSVFTDQLAALVVTTSAHGFSTGQQISISQTSAFVSWSATDGSSSGTSYLNIDNAMIEVKNTTAFYIPYALDWWWSNTSVQISAYGPGNNGTATLSIQAGVAIEHMVQLSNQLQANPWICVPHLANDAYVHSLGQLVATTLNPTLYVSFEFSNELWNAGFVQSTYAEKMAAVQGITKAQWIAKRSSEIFGILDTEFQNAGASDRLVKVVGSQAAGSSWSEELLAAFNSSVYNPNSVKVHALAIAPYFGNSIGDTLVNEGTVGSSTTDDVIDDCRPALRFNSYEWMLSSFSVAEKYGVKMVAYEGGQHLVGTYGNVDNDALTSLLTSTNRSPRMQGMYDEMFRLWSESGGELFQTFSFVGDYSKWGSWGVLETMDQNISTAPKYESVTRFAEYFKQGYVPPSASPSPPHHSGATQLGAYGMLILALLIVLF